MQCGHWNFLEREVLLLLLVVVVAVVVRGVAIVLESVAVEELEPLLGIGEAIFDTVAGGAEFDCLDPADSFSEAGRSNTTGLL